MTCPARGAPVWSSHVAPSELIREARGVGAGAVRVRGHAPGRAGGESNLPVTKVGEDDSEGVAVRPVVFIHTNAKQMLGAKVSAHALRTRSNDPAAFDVRILLLEDYPALHGREGQQYLRSGHPAVWKNDDLQSFTPLRFLPPQLLDWRGRALMIDPDVFALADVAELLERDMQGKAILARRVEPSDGREPYWASSVMLLDCAQLRHWRWEEHIEQMFAMQRDYSQWMTLATEPADSIGVLEEEWNHFDTLTDGTKLLHNTTRATQPWKTGLPLDFRRDPFIHQKHAPTPRELAGRLKRRLLGRPVDENVYRRHPDPRQEQLFFRLLGECLDSGVISRDELHTEISRGHIRVDAEQLVPTH
jgi:hypothetical protein